MPEEYLIYREPSNDSEYGDYYNLAKHQISSKYLSELHKQTWLLYENGVLSDSIEEFYM